MENDKEYYDIMMDEGFGPSECCPENDKLMYRGGSAYFCNWCGKEVIKRAAGFEPA